MHPIFTDAQAHHTERNLRGMRVFDKGHLSSARRDDSGERRNEGKVDICVLSLYDRGSRGGLRPSN